MTISEKESQSNRRVGISPTAVVATIIALVLIGVSAVVYLAVVEREASQVVALFALIGAPTILGLFNLIRTDRNSSALDTVRQQTNGAFTKVNQRLELMENELLGPPPELPGPQYRRSPPPVERTLHNYRTPFDEEYDGDGYDPRPWPPPPPPNRPQNRPGAHRRPQYGRE